MHGQDGKRRRIIIKTCSKKASDFREPSVDYIMVRRFTHGEGLIVVEHGVHRRLETPAGGEHSNVLLRSFLDETAEGVEEEEEEMRSS